MRKSERGKSENMQKHREKTEQTDDGRKEVREEVKERWGFQ